VDRVLKQVARSDKIGVENANELAIRRFESDRQRAGFESMTIYTLGELYRKLFLL